MSNNNAVRACGSSFAFCNGNCTSCEANNTYTTNSTSELQSPMYSVETEEDCLSKPKKEDYEKAKKNLEYASTCLRLSRKRKNELLDELCKERNSEKFYLELYEKHKEVVRRYEIYEEIAAKG